MNLLIDNRTDEPLTAELEDAIRRAAAEALRYEEFDEDCEISVSIVDNEEIREINRQFRSIDRATDVLSFPMLTFAEGEEEEKIKEKRAAKKAEEEKAAKKRAEKSAEGKETGDYTLSVTGNDVKSMTQSLVAESVSISAPDRSSFDIKA